MFFRLFSPTPLDPAAERRVRNFLRVLSRHDGFLADGELELDMWADESIQAVRRGYTYEGGGWGVGVSLTSKGQRFLAKG